MTTPVTLPDCGWSTEFPGVEEGEHTESVDAVVEFFASDPGRWLHNCIYYILDPLLMIIAICINSINVFVFLSGGVNDGITTVFLGLSISDLLFCVFMNASHLLSSVRNVFGVHLYLKTSDLAYIMHKWSGIWFMLSAVLTDFAATQKCACVALPLTFRNFFTFRRSAIVVAVLYFLAIAFHVPYLSVDMMLPSHDKYMNRTRLGYVTRSRAFAVVISEIIGIGSRMLVPFVSQGIVITCVIVMTHKLRIAASIRRKMISPGSVSEGSGLSVKKVETQRQSNVQHNQREYKSNQRKFRSSNVSDLGPKELHIIRSVNTVCIIFIAGMAPSTIMQTVYAAFPEFSDRGALRSLYFFMYGIRQLVVVGSMILNIFVYYHYNTKYRSTFNAKLRFWLCCTKKTIAASP